MKKPNITEGPWKLLSNNENWFHITAKDTTSDNSLVQVVSWKHGKHPVKGCNERWKADARAISAVPEMIDALIGAKKELEIWMANYGDDPDAEDVIADIESALEKAGVEL